MHNNTVLFTLHNALPLSDEAMAEVFVLGGQQVTTSEAHALRGHPGKEGAVHCSDAQLAGFLDGLILQRRGPRTSGAPVPAVTTELTNNLIFKKLRIALNLREDDVLRLLIAGGQALSKRALTPLFRKPTHKHYRACDDATLEAFFKGLTLEQAPG